MNIHVMEGHFNIAIHIQIYIWNLRKPFFFFNIFVLSEWPHSYNEIYINLFFKEYLSSASGHIHKNEIFVNLFLQNICPQRVARCDTGFCLSLGSTRFDKGDFTSGYFCCIFTILYVFLIFAWDLCPSRWSTCFDNGYFISEYFCCIFVIHLKRVYIGIFAQFNYISPVYDWQIHSTR